MKTSFLFFTFFHGCGLAKFQPLPLVDSKGQKLGILGEIFWTLIKGKELLHVKIEPPVNAQPPTKFEFLEYLKVNYDFTEKYFKEYQEEALHEFLNEFEWFKMREMYSNATFDIFSEYFNGDWRKGQEVHKVVITKRLYQTSPNSTQA